MNAPQFDGATGPTTARVLADLAVQAPDLFGHDSSDLPRPSDLPREAERLQSALGLSSEEMGARFGISRPSWENVKGGRQWTAGLKGQRAEIWRELEAEAAQKDQAGVIDAAPVAEIPAVGEISAETLTPDQGEPTAETSAIGEVATATPATQPAEPADENSEQAARKAEAERFLTLLDEEAETFCFQVFDDLESRKNPNLATTRHGALADLWPWLEVMNQAGAGVFVTINEVAPHAKRRNEHITRVRAVFADFDPPKTAAAPERYPLPPVWQVESSPGKRHAYWPVDGLDLDAFKPLQQAIIAALGSDPAPNDLTRVMRLPGFFHMKDPTTPHLVRLIDVDERLPYTPEQLAEAFPPVASQSAGATGTAPTGDRKTQDDYLAEILTGENIHDSALKIVGGMVATGMQDAAIRAVFKVLAVKVAETRGPDRAHALMGDELERMIRGARDKGYAPPPPVDASGLTGADAALVDDGKLTEQEAEQLIAWAWRTGTTLPAAPEQFESEQRDRKGKPFERLRVDLLAHPKYSAPWINLAWAGTQSAFLESVHKVQVG